MHLILFVSTLLQLVASGGIDIFTPVTLPYDTISAVAHLTHGGRRWFQLGFDKVRVEHTLAQVVEEIKPSFSKFGALSVDGFRASLASVKVGAGNDTAIAFQLAQELLKGIGKYHEVNPRCSQCSQQMGNALAKIVIAGRLMQTHGQELREFCAEHLHAVIYPRPLQYAMISFVNAVKRVENREGLSGEIKSALVTERQAMKMQLKQYILDQQSKKGGNFLKKIIRGHKVNLAQFYQEHLRGGPSVEDYEAGKSEDGGPSSHSVDVTEEVVDLQDHEVDDYLRKMFSEV